MSDSLDVQPSLHKPFVRAASSGEIFRAFLGLGLTSFGGPVAHLAYFRNEFVLKRAWVDEAAYADIVALCQFLPGPTSSQVGIALGLSRGGLTGALAAWFGFTLPSALLLVLFALFVETLEPSANQAWLHGLKLAAVPIVAQAILGMAGNLAPDRERATIAAGACLISSVFPSSAGQIGALVLAGLIGWRFLAEPSELVARHSPLAGRKSTGTAALLLFLVLLLGLPLLAATQHEPWLILADRYYRAGALIFGGGHVVLPFLRSEVVTPGWVSDASFMAGYGAAQAVPGPLFTIAAFLGTVSRVPPNGWQGGAIALLAIFLPGFLLVIGTLPFWEHVRGLRGMRRMLMGVNAAVVGLLLAAFFNPVWTSAVDSARDSGAATVGVVLLVLWRIPNWALVILFAVWAGAQPLLWP